MDDLSTKQCRYWASGKSICFRPVVGYMAYLNEVATEDPYPTVCAHHAEYARERGIVVTESRALAKALVFAEAYGGAANRVVPSEDISISEERARGLLQRHQTLFPGLWEDS